MDFQDCCGRRGGLGWVSGPMAEMTKDRRRDAEGGSDELVRILTDLTGDFERLDSMIQEQRRIIEEPTGQFGRGRNINRVSLRFKAEASEVAMRTRKALDQLRLFAEPAKPPAHGDPAREPPRELRPG
jgi:hypothetical protein